MFRVLLESDAHKPLFIGEGAFVSLAAHVAAIGLALFSAPPPSVAPLDTERQEVLYLIPLDRVNEPRPQQEAIAWVDPGSLVGNAGFEDRPVDAGAAVEAAVRGRGQEKQGEPEAFSVPQHLAIYDSVATELDVDSAVTRFPESAAPVYPATLLAQNIEGHVYVRYVVDTTGFADTASFQVVTATHPEFGRAVREALPGMRFTPAIQRSKKVRQLVEQPFAFRIQRPSSETAAKDVPPPAPR